MLFNSPEFLLAFLPAVLAGFFLIAWLGRPFWAVTWLVIASLFFYGWWKLDYLIPLMLSIGFNFGLGVLLGKRPNRWLLAFGIGVNIAAIGWFKYSGFLAESINDLTGAGVPVPQVVLPLAISFYTFQQIAYLVDAHAGETRETSLARYALFVVFFPQLIAGPIVHHREMLSQFDDPETYRPRLNNLVLGLAAFAIGLFKKVLIADPLSLQTPLAFGPAADGLAPGFVDAWLGSLAFALQLYFDFSGYSDMAIGLGLMFGIRLPINFASPFKSASIIEFWSRWHMTLTRFLTSYIYNPLVMAFTRRRVRAGKPLLQRSSPKLAPFVILLTVPTLITMGLAGIWHGAGWQFVVFGFLHGAMLVANQAWRALRRIWGVRRSFGRPGRAVGVLVTFVGVTVSLVFFKASSLDQALHVVQGMAGFGGEFTLAPRLGGHDWTSMGVLAELFWRLLTLQGMLILGGMVIVWALPNTMQYIDYLAGSVDRRLAEAKDMLRRPFFRPRLAAYAQAYANPILGMAVGVLLSLALLRALSVAPTEFLYFTF